MNEIEQIVLDYLREQVVFDGGRETLSPDTPLLAGGLLDSMALTSLVGYAEHRFKISIPDPEILPRHFETPRAVAELIRRLSAG